MRAGGGVAGADAAPFVGLGTAVPAARNISTSALSIWIVLPVFFDVYGLVVRFTSPAIRLPFRTGRGSSPANFGTSGAMMRRNPM